MKIFLALTLVLTFSCASKEEKRKAYCNPTGAYDKGYNDGKDNLNLSNEALSFCPSDRAKLMVQYREGYYKGQEMYAKTPKLPTSALGSSPNISQPRKCLFQFRGDTFLGEGYSYGEAIRNAQTKCETVYGKICPAHCDTMIDTK